MNKDNHIVDPIKATAIIDAEKVKTLAAIEAEKLKENAKTLAAIEAEKLKENALIAAKTVKENAVLNAEKLIRTAEEAAKQQLRLLLENAMFKAIFNSIHDGAIVTSITGKILFHNPAAIKIINLKSFEEHEPIFAKYFHFYKVDKITPWEPNEDPLARAMKGKTTIGELMFLKSEKSKGDYISCMAVPLSYGTEPIVVGGFMLFRIIRKLTDGNF
jgi:PAS domain-containing protein